MTWLKWLGEEGGSETTSACGIEFPAGVWVEVLSGDPDVEHMVRKARGNRFFEVSDSEPDENVPLASGLDGLDVPVPKRRGRPPKAQG